MLSGYLTSVIARKVDHGQSTAAIRCITFPTHHLIIISPKLFPNLAKMNMLAPTFGRGFLRRLGQVLHPARPNPAAPLTSSSLLPSTQNIVQHYVDARSLHSPHSNALAVAFAATSLAVVEGSRDRPKTTSCASPSKNERKQLSKNAPSNATLRKANAKGGKTEKSGLMLNLLDPSDNAFHLVRIFLTSFL